MGQHEETRTTQSGIQACSGTKRPASEIATIRRMSDAMVTMTRTATEKVQDFIQEHGVEGDVGLRVAVLPGGCSGFQYGLNIEDGPEDEDEVLDVAGVRVFIDPFSAQYLSGVEIDYVTSMMGQGFTFRNPNASGGCGCGSSFTV